MSDRDWKIAVAGRGCFQVQYVDVRAEMMALVRNLDRSEMSDRDWKIAVVGCGCFHG